MPLNYMKDIAMSMGLCPEKGLPMANEENKQLLLLIDSLDEQKKELHACFENFKERTERIVAHTKNSELSHGQNMKLINAFQTDLRTEQHLFKVADRESSKLKSDLKDMHQELKNISQYEENAENDIKRRNKTISDLSNRINWIKTALVEWQQCMDAGHEANQLIEKYCKEDQQKYIDVETKRRILQNTINKDRKGLIDLVEEQKSLEQNLDRTANLYRNAHMERRQMVDTWKTAVHHMNQREHDILHTEAEFEKVLKHCKRKEIQLKAEEDALDAMIANNREVEENISLLNDEISDLREKLQNIREMVILRDQEVDILKKELQGLAYRVQLQRHQNRNDIQRKSEKDHELVQCIEGNKKLQISHDNLKNKNMNAQERLRVLEEMIDSEERTKEKLAQETNRMNGLLFRTQQHLQRFKDEQKILEVENRGINLSITAMQNSLKETEKHLEKQTEAHYDIALKAVLLERRIAKLKGSTVDPQEERKKLVELTQLEEHYDVSLKTLQSLQTQTTKLESDMRNMTIAFNNDMKEIETMNYKIQEAQLYCEGGQHKVRLTTRSNQEKIVELSILKMRVNEMENQITQCEDKAYNLDKHRLELTKTFKERMVEIGVQYDLMYQKRKLLSEELSTLKCDIGDRSIRIEAAKARYELTSKLLGTNEDGSLVTATQMKVENAQEKQMLLDEGNALNASVLKAEQEIKAMEHTLALMNCSNQIYRRNFDELDEAAEDLENLKRLQSEFCQLLTELKTLRNRTIQQERQIENMLQERETLEESIQELYRRRMDNTEMLTKVHKDLLDQSVKIERASREVKTAWKTVCERSIDKMFLADYRRGLELQELEKRNSAALKLFADLIDSDLDLAPHATKMLFAKGIECPKGHKCRKYYAWRAEFSDLSIASSKEIISSRSSGSENSEAKMSSSNRASIVSIDFPIETCKITK